MSLGIRLKGGWRGRAGTWLRLASRRWARSKSRRASMHERQALYSIAGPSPLTRTITEAGCGASVAARRRPPLDGSSMPLEGRSPGAAAGSSWEREGRV